MAERQEAALPRSCFYYLKTLPGREDLPPACLQFLKQFPAGTVTMVSIERSEEGLSPPGAEKQMSTVHWWTPRSWAPGTQLDLAEAEMLGLRQASP